MESEKNTAVVTVLGKDRVGIIAGISNLLLEYGININDISQTILDDIFTMVMLVKGPSDREFRHFRKARKARR